MMKHEFYTRNNFAEKFLVELKNRIEKETAENPLLRALATRRESSEDKAKRDRDREKEKEKEKERDRERREKKHRKVCYVFALSCLVNRWLALSEMTDYC